jgi:hypothetical protein
VCLLAPFAYAVGDAVVEGRNCEADREQLIGELATRSVEKEAELGSAGPPAVQVVERIVEVAVPAEQLPLGPNELGAFAFVSGESLVLDSAADPRWAYGSVGGEVEFDMESVRAHRKVDWQADPDLAELQEETFVLYDNSGEVCRAKLRNPRLGAEISGDFYPLLDEKDGGAFAELLDGPAIDDARAGKRTQRRRWLEQLLLERVMDHAENWLLVDLRVVRGDCSEALWGRAASRSEPVIFVDDDDQLEREALRERFRGTDTHRAARRVFAEELSNHDPGVFSSSTWSDYEAETLTTQRWRAPKLPAFDIVEVGEQGECGDPDTYATATWTGQQRVTEGTLGHVDALFAIDGEVHALSRDFLGGESSRLYRFDAGFELVSTASVDFYGCNC